MRAKEALIRLEGVGFSFPGGRMVLSSLDIVVRRGEYVGIIGRSGCGKSTLLNLLAGIAPYRLRGTFSGKGMVSGRSLPYSPEDSSSFCAYVQQEPDDSFVSGKVLDEVAFGPRCKGDPEGVAGKKALSSLRMLGIDRLGESDTDCLSGGERQLVAIASALSAGHRLLLLDEPNSKLDPNGRMVVSKGLRELRRNDPDLTIVQVEQHQENLLRCDRIGLMHDGRIVAISDPFGILTDRETLFRGGLEIDRLASLYSAGIGCRMVPERIDPWMMVPKLVDGVKGIRTDFTPDRKFGSKMLPMISLERATYRYPGGKAGLRGADIEISGPGPLCVMGPNGSGKTTLGKLLCGLIRPDGGRISGPKEGFYLFQKPGNMMFEDTVEEELSALPRKVPPDVVERLGLTDLLGSNPFSLSVGERQRLGIAMVVGSGSPFAVLDEPFKGLDQISIRRVYDVLEKPEFPPFVLITNDADPAYLCPRVLILDNGSVIFNGSPEDILGRAKTYDVLSWPTPGNVLIGRSAGSGRAATYEAIERGLRGVLL